MNTRTTDTQAPKGKAVLAMAAAAVALAALMCLTLGAGKAWAAGFSPLDDLQGGKAQVVSYKGKARDVGYRDYLSTEGKVTAVKSSNAKVATAKAVKVSQYGRTTQRLRVTLKKAGTTELSFKVGGKAYSVSYKVVGYTNPLKTLKIGGKDYLSRFDAKKLDKGCDIGSTSSVAVKGFSGKASVKAKGGWKIDYMLQHSDTIAMGELKNGGKLDKATEIDISLTNKKTGQTEMLYLVASKAGSLQAAGVAL